MVKVYKKTLKKSTKIVRSKPMYEGDPDVFRVDHILNKRIRNKTIEYYLKWTGYSESENSWIAAKNVTKDLIKNFNKKPKQNAADKSERTENFHESIECQSVNVSTHQELNERMHIDDGLEDASANEILVSPTCEIQLFSDLK